MSSAAFGPLCFIRYKVSTAICQEIYSPSCSTCHRCPLYKTTSEMVSDLAQIKRSIQNISSVLLIYNSMYCS
ncbi:hypothetical protein ILYODFUR_023756 [Ilyodon furcidens]|uniref:Uncharacterized protein n=1 Tax=Ilyodon furcidens TaxID=33524 RepID=A0ABV0TX63_9TELE